MNQARATLCNLEIALERLPAHINHSGLRGRQARHELCAGLADAAQRAGLRVTGRDDVAPESKQELA